MWYHDNLNKNKTKQNKDHPLFRFVSTTSVTSDMDTKKANNINSNSNNSKDTSKKENNNTNSDKNDSSFDQLSGISAPSDHALFRTSFGIIFAFGLNSCGQFGDRKSRSQTSVVGGLDNKTTTQLACAKYFSIGADSSGNVYVSGSIEDRQIANVLYERIIFEQNENSYLNTSNNNNNNDNNNDSNNDAPNRLSLNLIEQIEATQAHVCGIAQDNDDRVTVTTAANESGGRLDDENDNKDQSKTDEHKTNEENELNGDALIQDILSKLLFDGGTVCVRRINVDQHLTDYNCFDETFD